MQPIKPSRLAERLGIIALSLQNGYFSAEASQDLLQQTLIAVYDLPMSKGTVD